MSQLIGISMLFPNRITFFFGNQYYESYWTLKLAISSPFNIVENQTLIIIPILCVLSKVIL